MIVDADGHRSSSLIVVVAVVTLLFAEPTLPCFAALASASMTALPCVGSVMNAWPVNVSEHHAGLPARSLAVANTTILLVPGDARATEGRVRDVVLKTVPETSLPGKRRISVTTFRDPLLLLAFVPVVVAAFVVLRRGLRTRPAPATPRSASFASVGRSRSRARAACCPWRACSRSSLLVVAFARPQLVENEEEIRTEGIDIMLALDISGSMQAEDFKPKNRLHVAKSVVAEFLDLIRNDRVGLVVFAGQAFTQCPLTLDYDVLRTMLARVEIGMIEDGTAIGTALANCVNRLQGLRGQEQGRRSSSPTARTTPGRSIRRPRPRSRRRSACASTRSASGRRAARRFPSTIPSTARPTPATRTVRSCSPRSTRRP